MASGKVFGVPERDALPYAVATELFHSATIVLDDLPSMDDSDLRRGKESCHNKFGVATAELCSHYLYQRGRLLMEELDLDDRRKSRISSATSRTALRLIRGQEKDLYELERDVSLLDLFAFYKFLRVWV